MLRFITGLWLAFMLVLSHIGETASGEESRWLSSMTGVEEGLLRKAAHVVVYAVLGCLSTVAWPEAELWVRAVLFITPCGRTQILCNA